MRAREREKGGRRMNEGRAERRGTTWWHTVEGFAVAHPGITYLGRRPYSRRARAGLHNGHGGRSLPRRFTIMRREGSHSWASHLSATKGYRGSRWITILSSLWPPRGMVLCAVAWTHCGFIVGLESGSVKGEIGGEKESKLNHWTILQFETKFGRFSFLKDIKKLRISNLNYWIGILLYVFFFLFFFRIFSMWNIYFAKLQLWKSLVSTLCLVIDILVLIKKKVESSSNVHLSILSSMSNLPRMVRARTSTKSHKNFLPGVRPSN